MVPRCLVFPLFASLSLAATTCFTTYLDPTPTGSICQVEGSLQKPNLISRQPCAQPTESCGTACINACLTNSKCGSFGFKYSSPSYVHASQADKTLSAVNNACQILSGGVQAQGFQPATTGNVYYFARACFATTCLTVIPAPTCTVLSGGPTYTYSSVYHGQGYQENAFNEGNTLCADSNSAPRQFSLNPSIDNCAAAQSCAGYAYRSAGASFELRRQGSSWICTIYKGASTEPGAWNVLNTDVVAAYGYST